MIDIAYRFFSNNIKDTVESYRSVGKSYKSVGICYLNSRGLHNFTVSYNRYSEVVDSMGRFCPIKALTLLVPEIGMRLFYDIGLEESRKSTILRIHNYDYTYDEVMEVLGDRVQPIYVDICIFKTREYSGLNVEHLYIGAEGVIGATKATDSTRTDSNYVNVSAKLSISDDVLAYDLPIHSRDNVTSEFIINKLDNSNLLLGLVNNISSLYYRYGACYSKRVVVSLGGVRWKDLENKLNIFLREVDWRSYDIDHIIQQDIIDRLEEDVNKRVNKK